MSAVLAVLLATLSVQDAAPELEGAGWINSRELSVERLKGKIVALYFYEEG